MFKLDSIYKVIFVRYNLDQEMNPLHFISNGNDPIPSVMGKIEVEF